MAVMRSIMYVPGNNPKMVEKAPSIPADIITLDLEDSVPPSEKEAARKLVAEKLKYAGSGGISEEMAYELVAGSLLGCIHQVLVGVPKKLKVSTLFTNPDVTKPDQVRNIIKSGKLNFATVMEAQNIKMLNGKPLFADY